VDPFKPQHNVRGSFSASEWRRRKAETLYAAETELRNNGVVDERLIYDEEHEVFRLAFSREHANWAVLRRRGMRVAVVNLVQILERSRQRRKTP
jgi:hypothetical protein